MRVNTGRGASSFAGETSHAGKLADGGRGGHPPRLPNDKHEFRVVCQNTTRYERLSALPASGMISLILDR